MFCGKNAADGQKSLKIVDDVVLLVDFGAVEGYAEASEVEGEGDAGVSFKLLPAGAALGGAVYAADDEHGAGDEGEVRVEGVGSVDVVEGSSRLACGGGGLSAGVCGDNGAGARGVDIADEGGRCGALVRAYNIYMSGLLIVGEAEDEA